MGAWARATGFRSATEYVTTITADGFWTYPKLVARRFFAIKRGDGDGNEDDQGDNVHLRRTLTLWNLINVGSGFMIGAGIFVSPGRIAVDYTGPALFLAYVVAGISAFLSSFCYSELSVKIPLAGASYNYVYSSLGEFIAWVVAANMILQYTLSTAAVARGWAPYFGILCNKGSSYFLYNWKGYVIDGWAGGLSLVCVAILAWGMKESAVANDILNVIQILFMVLVIIAGLTKADRSNFKPFFKQGGSWKGVFNGGALAFFSYLGFDAVATTAEEVINPQRDLPLGIMGSVTLVTILYLLMCVTLSLMVPTSEIDPTASFAAAFATVGYEWGKYVIAIAALLGIANTVLVGVLGGARMVVGAARERMIPPVFATVGERRQTPWVATWALGIAMTVIAVFNEFVTLTEVTSIGTLMVFMIVALALIWLRCYVPGKSSQRNFVLLTIHTLAFVGLALGFTLVWTLPTYRDYKAGYTTAAGAYVAPVTEGKWNHDQWKWLVALGIVYVAAIVSFTLTVSQDSVSTKYKIPFFPTIPALSVFVNIFLMGQIRIRAYRAFGWWTIAAVALYFVYGVVAQQAYQNRKEYNETLPGRAQSSDDGTVTPHKLVKDVHGPAPAAPLRA